MASNINTTNIDTAYPVAGQDNDSQGFRDNFFNTNQNFIEAKAEIEALQGATTGNYVFDITQVPDNTTDNWVLTYDYNGGVNSEIRLAAIPPTDETAPGIIQLATQTEVDAGTDIIKAITPATLAAWPGNGLITGVPPKFERLTATGGELVVNTTISTVALTAIVDGDISLQVFRNGSFQDEGAGLDYTVTGANQITFTVALIATDVISMIAY